MTSRDNLGPETLVRNYHYSLPCSPEMPSSKILDSFQTVSNVLIQVNLRYILTVRPNRNREDRFVTYLYKLNAIVYCLYVSGKRNIISEIYS
jgi:hypothetical protein